MLLDERAGERFREAGRQQVRLAVERRSRLTTTAFPNSSGRFFLRFRTKTTNATGPIPLIQEQIKSGENCDPFDGTGHCALAVRGEFHLKPFVNPSQLADGASEGSSRQTCWS